MQTPAKTMYSDAAGALGSRCRELPVRPLQACRARLNLCCAYLHRPNHALVCRLPAQETGRDPITSEVLEEDDLLELTTAQVRFVGFNYIPAAFCFPSSGL